MKILKTSLLASSALLLTITSTTTFGEAGISYNLGGAPADVTANVRFKIKVPEVIILRVGDWGGTENTVTWDFNFGAGLSSETSNDNATQDHWNKITGTADAQAATSDDESTSDGKLAVAVFSNTGDVKLSASGTEFVAVARADFTPTAATMPTIAKISATAEDNKITHPTAYDGNTPVTLNNAGGIVKLEDTWAYQYASGGSLAAGEYDASILYTLANI